MCCGHKRRQRQSALKVAATAIAAAMERRAAAKALANGAAPVDYQLQPPQEQRFIPIEEKKDILNPPPSYDETVGARKGVAERKW